MNTNTVKILRVLVLVMTCVPIQQAMSANSSSEPALAQHVSSTTNILGRGLVANNFKFSLPNSVGAGNVLVLGISYGFAPGRTATVSDTNGNVWPAAPAVSVTDSGLNLTAAIFVLPNAHAGPTTITVSFNSNINNQVFQYTLSEFYNVATASPVSGAISTPGTVSPGLIGGSFTPGNNDANGGNLIWSYFADVDGEIGDSTQATLFTASSAFTLLDADISGPAGAPPYPHASEYLVQPVAAAINPGMSVTHKGGHDTYLGVSVSLKAASGAGTPPPSGMHIVHFALMTNQTPTAGAWKLQFPSSGNLIVMTMQEQIGIPISSFSDTMANSYTKVGPDPSAPQIWFTQNAKTDPNLMMTVNITADNGWGVTYAMYDIAGASPSAYDGVAFKPSYGDSNGSNEVNSPSITPTSPGLTIARTSLGQGPSSGLAPGCPSGAVFDYVYYHGETDLDTMDNADFAAHVFNTDLLVENWNIAVANGGRSTTVSSIAAHFKGESGPPVITTQPADQTATAGQTASFNVVAAGTAPLAFQWKKNGNNISGANSAAYTTPATTMADDGAQFTVVVSNSAGVANSNPATLTVNAAQPVLTSGPSASPNPALVGQSVAFSVAASDPEGEALTYAWIFGDGGTGAGATPAHTYTAAGTYMATVTVTDTDGLSATGNVTVTVNAVASPQITSALTATCTVGQSFTYTITATNSPTSYNAMPLPAGLTLNTSTGVISGVPSAAGTISITISATNASGTGSATLVLTVGAGGTYVAHINFQPTWSTVPAGYQMDDGSVYSATRGYGWNVGLDSRDRSPINSDQRLNTFVYSSSPATWTYNIANGNYVVTLAVGDASYAQGPQLVTVQGTVAVNKVTTQANQFVTVTNFLVTVTTGQLTIVIGGGGGNTMFNYVDIKTAGAPAVPAITSSSTANGTVGAAFTYAVTASNSPTSFNATGLPSGLSVNTSTGAITGTPAAAGTSNVTISATNAVGTGSATLSLTINPASAPKPVITSPLAATGTVGAAFSYAITATNSPTSYNATGLPVGLSINTSTGMISGTPTTAGTSNVTISATNASGTGSATLVLTVGTGGTYVARINFQPTSSPAPAGYQKDDGSVFTTARGYGWNAWGVVDSRQRNVNPDSRLDTFVGGASPATWTYNIANGNYVVTLAVGDASYAQGPQLVTVQGTVAVNKVTTQVNQFVTVTNFPVAVTTGILTIAIGGGGGSTMLNYVDIMPATTSPTMGAATALAPSATQSAASLSVAPAPFTVQKLAGTVNFQATGHDGMSLVGAVPGLPSVSKLSGATVQVWIGGEQATFTLDGRGRAKSRNGALSLTNKSGSSAIKVTLKGGTWTQPWIDAGIDPTVARTNTKLKINVMLSINGAFYSAEVTTTYSSKARVGWKFRY